MTDTPAPNRKQQNEEERPLAEQYSRALSWWQEILSVTEQPAANHLMPGVKDGDSVCLIAEAIGRNIPESRLEILKLEIEILIPLLSQKYRTLAKQIQWQKVPKKKEKEYSETVGNELAKLAGERKNLVRKKKREALLRSARLQTKNEDGQDNEGI